MCVAIYLVLFALAFMYSESIIEPLGLTIQGDGEPMLIALGWEIVPAMWPLFALAMVLASGVTLFVSRRIQARGKS